jgi:tripartite motif-containing protein 71
MKRTLLLLVALGALLPTVGWGQPPAVISEWNCSRPIGMALDNAGTLYVASYDSHHIYMFTESGGALGYWGTYGNNPWSVTGPSGVALDGHGRIFVAEWSINNGDAQSGLQVFTTGGVYVANWGKYGYGAGPGQFVSPFGVAVGPDNCLYVTDSDLPRVQVFASDGTYLRQWPTSAFGIAINAAGDVYVADKEWHRIRKFTSSGALLREWGAFGGGPGQFNQPHGVVLDAAGHLYVADTYNHRIQVFTGDGDYLTEWGGLGAGAGQFYRPMGVLVDCSGNVYVADTWNGRIQKFGLVPTPARATTWGRVKALYR